MTARKDGPFPMSTGKLSMSIQKSIAKTSGQDVGENSTVVRIILEDRPNPTGNPSAEDEPLYTSNPTLMDIFRKARDQFFAKENGHTADELFPMQLDGVAVLLGGFPGFHEMHAQVTLMREAATGIQEAELREKAG